MLPRYFNGFFLCVSACLTFLIFSGCTSSKGHGAIYKDSCSKDPITITSWQLLEVHRGRLVKVKGHYRHGPEMDALFPGSATDEGKALWVDFNYSNLVNTKSKKPLLGKDFKELASIYDKEVSIIGVLDLDNKGHLDAYKAH